MTLLYYPYDYYYFAIFGLSIFAVSCCISILLGVWVYKDAKKRNMNASVWVLIVLLIGCIGLIIYLIVREPIQPARVEGAPQYQQPTYPPKEGTTTPPPEPARPVEKPTKYCGNCGGKIPVDATFCPLCGSKT